MSGQETGTAGPYLRLHGEAARERYGRAARKLAEEQGWLYPEQPEQALALCFLCVTGTCGHHEQLTPVRSGGIPLHSVPAITARQGTLLCLDCAMAVRCQ